MKIDLHCHTRKTKQGDAKTRNVEKTLFSQKVLESDVKIIAITNHNLFDYEQFLEFQAAISDIKTAVINPIGTPIRIAANVPTIEDSIMYHIPYDGLLAVGFHVLPNNKSMPPTSFKAGAPFITI